MEVRRIKDWSPDDTLEHHGIKGQRWGIRRYQNKDGSLTAEGREHYGSKISGEVKKARDNYLKSSTDIREIREKVENTKTGFEEESRKFDKLLLDSNIKYKHADEMYLGIGQMALLNRGINPNKYSKQLEKAENIYKDVLEKHGNEPLSENKLGKKVTVKTLHDSDLGSFGLYDSFSLKSPYKEDDELFEIIAQTARKNMATKAKKAYKR